MKLLYQGPKQRRIIQFPIPVMSKAEIRGEAVFEDGKETELKDDWGQQLLDLKTGYFTLVQTSPSKPAPGPLAQKG